jgi:hypothetical protein
MVKVPQPSETLPPPYGFQSTGEDSRPPSINLPPSINPPPPSSNSQQLSSSQRPSSSQPPSISQQGTAVDQPTSAAQPDPPEPRLPMTPSPLPLTEPFLDHRLRAYIPAKFATARLYVEHRLGALAALPVQALRLLADACVALRRLVGPHPERVHAAQGLPPL